MQPEVVLAVDLGGTKLRAAVVAADGRIIDHISRPTPAREGAAAVVEAIACAVEQVAHLAPVSAPLGLCAPGPLDAEAGIALHTPTIEGFRNFPLRQALADRLGRAVMIDNDGHAAAIGEWHFGAASGQQNFLYLTFSTGIGGAAVVDGHLIRGQRGLAGHFGHMRVGSSDEKCACGAVGCWEAVSSGTALQRRARKGGYADLEAVFQANRLGDPNARAFLEDAAKDMIQGIVSLTHAFSPDVIVLGGGVMSEFTTFQPMLAAQFAQECLPPFRQTQLVRAELGDQAGVVGMAVQVANRQGAEIQL